MPTTITEFPVEYQQALDEVLVGATYAGLYQVQGAEFVGGRKVSYPRIDFGKNPDPVAYDRFKSDGEAKIERDIYQLDNDEEKVFYTDAVDAIDEAAASATTIVSEWERTVFAPHIDKKFFAAVNKNAGNKETTKLTVDNIKGEIRKARTAFTNAGLRGGNLYMSSEALGLLEDATDRQWSNETTITDTVGSYDGFQVFEAPEDLLQTDFTVISGGQRTIRHIIKRAAAYMFAPGQHTQGDGWLDQLRWVYGFVALKNKTKGIYTNIGTTTNVEG